MTQIAAQLYTLREFTKTPGEIAATMKRVKGMGYGAVQCSGMGKIEAGELAKILEGEGLVCCATHGPIGRLKEETEKVIEEHRMWGCKYTAIGGFWPATEEAGEWPAFAGEYSAIAEKFAGSGVSIGYHNHSHELAKYGGKTALATLWEGFSKDVWMEIDTYWIAYGGADPVEWIEKVKGRIPCVHLKDMEITPKKEHRMAEVGEGNLNWPRILRACRSAGVEWYIVEQDDCYGKDPFGCLETSLRNLKGMGLS